MHSPKFDKVKSYYDRKLWNEQMVRNAVAKGWISSDEFYLITGGQY